MAEGRRPTPRCEGDGENRCGEQILCTVAFEEPTLRGLEASVGRWLTDNPTHGIVCLSHAVETHAAETPWETAPMSNPRPVPAHTGLLVVRPQEGRG
jgi:hypothetical protein